MISGGATNSGRMTNLDNILRLAGEFGGRAYGSYVWNVLVPGSASGSVGNCEEMNIWFPFGDNVDRFVSTAWDRFPDVFDLTKMSVLMDPDAHPDAEWKNPCVFYRAPQWRKMPASALRRSQKEFFRARLLLRQ